MIPYDLDPSLYAHEPEPPLLDDGFSPPHHDDDASITKPSAHDAPDAQPEEGDSGLGPKSLF